MLPHVSDRVQCFAYWAHARAWSDNELIITRPKSDAKTRTPSKFHPSTATRIAMCSLQNQQCFLTCVCLSHKCVSHPTSLSALQLHSANHVQALYEHICGISIVGVEAALSQSKVSNLSMCLREDYYHAQTHTLCHTHTHTHKSLDIGIYRWSFSNLKLMAPD